MRILDMGCGNALSSIFLAEEFGIEVGAAELWSSPEDFAAGFVSPGLADEPETLPPEYLNT